MVRLSRLIWIGVQSVTMPNCNMQVLTLLRPPNIKPFGLKEGKIRWSPIFSNVNLPRFRFIVILSANSHLGNPTRYVLLTVAQVEVIILNLMSDFDWLYTQLWNGCVVYLLNISNARYCIFRLPVLYVGTRPYHGIDLKRPMVASRAHNFTKKNSTYPRWDRSPTSIVENDGTQDTNDN